MTALPQISRFIDSNITEGDFKVAIEFVGEDDAVHMADQGVYPDEVIHSQLPGGGKSFGLPVHRS